MAISVVFFEYEDILFRPEDIQISDDSAEVQINRQGIVIPFSISRKRMTLTGSGLTNDQLQKLESKLSQNITALLTGVPKTETLDVFDYRLFEMLLVKVTPTQFVEVEDKSIYGQVTLEFISLAYTA